MAEKSLNRVELIGRLGKDAETAYTKSQKAVTKFSVATENRWKDANGEWKSKTNWCNVVLWGMEKVADYLKKGTRVFVAGRLETRDYEGKDGKKVYVTEVIGEDIILLGSKGEGGGGGGGGGEMQSAPRGAAAPAPAARADDPAGWGAPTDDDVPF